MEEEVMEATLSGSKDGVLMLLIEVTKEALMRNGVLAETIMDEPIFWRRFFKRWVQNALDEDMELTRARDDALREVNNRLGKG